MEPAAGTGFRAPRELVALADDVRACGASTWEIHMGSAVAAFVAANGPSAIVAYNWNKVWTKIDSAFVERVAVVLSAASDYAKHDLADTLRLTPLGQRELPRNARQVASSGAAGGLTAKQVSLRLGFHGARGTRLDGRSDSQPSDARVLAEILTMQPFRITITRVADTLFRIAKAKKLDGWDFFLTS